MSDERRTRELWEVMTSPPYIEEMPRTCDECHQAVKGQFARLVFHTRGGHHLNIPIEDRAQAQKLISILTLQVMV